MGLIDRPFIHEVVPLTASRGFGTLSVMSYQPSVPSTSSRGDYFPLADAYLPPGPRAFAAMCSFKLPEPHSAGVSMQQEPPQQRFGEILRQRPANDWPPAPLVDIDAIMAFESGRDVGTFPIVDMKKVDMTAYNEGKPVHERVELILYRLLSPLPSDGTDGYDANDHVLVHAFTIDRNGLLMACNHLGMGWTRNQVASLSYSFVVHVNPNEAVMDYGEDQWWVQEASFPRAGAGRAVITSKVWSPQGVHVATEYQDGLPRAPKGTPKVKL